MSGVVIGRNYHGRGGIRSALSSESLALTGPKRLGADAGAEYRVVTWHSLTRWRATNGFPPRNRSARPPILAISYATVRFWSEVFDGPMATASPTMMSTTLTPETIPAVSEYATPNQATGINARIPTATATLGECPSEVIHSPLHRVVKNHRSDPTSQEEVNDYMHPASVFANI